MAISDLTGTTWQLNAVIDIQSLLGAQFNITFESNDTNYTYILFNDVRLVLQYDSTRVYYDDGSYWSNENYRTVSFTGGTDATNATLIAWLEANATQVVSGSELTITYNNNTIHTSTTDDTFTLQCNGKVMASDVTIQATDVDSLTVTYGGNTIASGSGTVTKTLSCNGKVMSSNVGVSVTMNSGGGITDLTGTAWYFNSSPSLPYLDEIGYEIAFSLEEEWTDPETYDPFQYFNLLVMDGHTATLSYLDSYNYQWLPAYYEIDDAWLDDFLRTIHIIGGTDATNTDLINWLQDNATQIT